MKGTGLIDLSKSARMIDIQSFRPPDDIRLAVDFGVPAQGLLDILGLPGNLTKSLKIKGFTVDPDGIYATVIAGPQNDGVLLQGPGDLDQLLGCQTQAIIADGNNALETSRIQCLKGIRQPFAKGIPLLLRAIENISG